ncbi:nuclear transport factor 2 family protein [Thermodesulfobacteriota bacterium]
MATIEELEARVERLEAIAGVERTLRDYAVLVDCGRWNEVTGLFTEDANLEVSGYGGLDGVDYDVTKSGRTTIRDYYAGNYRGVKGPPRTKHNIIAGPIEIEGNEAVAVAYLLDIPPATPGNPGGGIYELRMRRQADGRWRFATMRIVSTGKQTVSEALLHKV